MNEPRRISRIIEHWTLPEASQVVPHVRRARIQRLFGVADLEQVPDVLSPDPGCPDEPKARLELLLAQGSALKRKESFDEVFIEFGRGLRPGLLLAQWYHKYDLQPHDERSLLPRELWARGEDYIWYSQGPSKGASSLAQGLPRRHGSAQPLHVRRRRRPALRRQQVRLPAGGGCVPPRPSPITGPPWPFTPDRPALSRRTTTAR